MRARDAEGMEMGDQGGRRQSPVGGLQGEAGEDDNVERVEEGDALEMSEDIDGKMQDVPDKEDEDEG